MGKDSIIRICYEKNKVIDKEKSQIEDENNAKQFFVEWF